MANTAFGTNDAQTVSYWSTMTMREALKRTTIWKLKGKTKESFIVQLSDLEKSNGDTIKFDLLMNMTGNGITGDYAYC